jgi:hypothetical protein
MSDPIAFANAGLDEDEATAGAAYCQGPSAQQPTAPPEGSWWTTAQILGALGPGTWLDARHIVLHDPARALREVEAGRRILARHRGCPDGDGPCETWFGHEPPCPDLADLLVRWADRPGYRPEWAPEAVTQP